MNALSLNSVIPNSAQSAELGIARGMAGLNVDAQSIAQSGTGSGGDVTAALVDSLQQKLSVEVNAKVLSTADQMLGTLLDVTA